MTSTLALETRGQRELSVLPGVERGVHDNLQLEENDKFIIFGKFPYLLIFQIFLENNSILMKKFNNKLNFVSLLQYNLYRLFPWQNLIQFSRIYFPNFNIYILVLQTQLFPSIFITRYPVYLLRAEYPVSPLINSVVKKRHASSELLAKKGVFLRRCVFNARWIEQEEGNRSNRG